MYQRRRPRLVLLLDSAFDFLEQVVAADFLDLLAVPGPRVRLPGQEVAAALHAVERHLERPQDQAGDGVAGQRVGIWADPVGRNVGGSRIFEAGWNIEDGQALFGSRAEHAVSPLLGRQRQTLELLPGQPSERHTQTHRP